MKKHFAIGIKSTTQRLSVYDENNAHIDMSLPRHTYRPDVTSFGSHSTRIALLRRFLAFTEPEMAETIDTCSEVHLKRVAASHFRGKDSTYKVLRIDPPH